MLPPPLSTLGVFHTFATVIALWLALDNVITEGRINLSSRNGKAYWVLTAFGCVSTIWLVARTGTYGPGHALAAIVMALLVISLGLGRRPLAQAIVLTTTLLFSLIPSIMETLTRLPVGQPWATGPEDGLVHGSLAVAFLGYLGIVSWQVKSLRRRS